MCYKFVPLNSASRKPASISARICRMLSNKGFNSSFTILNTNSGSTDKYSCEMIFLIPIICFHGVSGYSMKNFLFVRSSTCLIVSPMLCRHIHVELNNTMASSEVKKSWYVFTFSVVRMAKAVCRSTKRSRSVNSSLDVDCIAFNVSTEQLTHVLVQG